MATSEGKILSAPQAAPILAAFNIAPDTWLDPVEGMQVDFNGKKYWIMQGEYEIQGGNRPDGWHFVYELSADDIPKTEPDLMDSLDFLMKIAAFGIGTYLIVNLLGFFKNRN